MPTLKSIIKDLVDFLSMYENVYVVGGAVRDRLLNRPLTDIDLIFPRNPTNAAKILASKMGGTSFVLDPERNVIRVTTPHGLQVDLAAQQGSQLHEDLELRDFTINAMAVNLNHWIQSNWKNKIIDPFHGLEDLQKKTITPIMNKVFKSDVLRLLRAFRIAAELDFTIPKDTLSLINKHRKWIRKAAPERIREELLKIFQSPRSHRCLLQMEKCGLLESLFPEIKSMKNIGMVYYGTGGVLKHTLDSLKNLEDIFHNLKSWFPRAHKIIRIYLEDTIAGYPRYSHLKWAIFLHDFGKPKTAKKINGRLRFFEHEHIGANLIPKLSQRFRWSTDEMDRYSKIVRHHMRPGNLATHPEVSDKAIFRFFRDLGDDGIGMLLVSLGDHLAYLSPSQRKARSSPHEKLTQRMVNQYYFRREKVMPPKLLSGHDIMQAFDLKPSPLIGDLLRDLMEAQSEGTIKTSEQAITYLKDRLPLYQKPDQVS